MADDDRHLDSATLAEGLKDRGRLDNMKEQIEFLQSQAKSQRKKMRRTYGLNTVVWHDDAPEKTADQEPLPNYSAAEQDIIDVIREAGGEVDSQAAILDALSKKGKIPSVGTTKITLAALKRHGFLSSGPDGKGYRLPE